MAAVRDPLKTMVEIPPMFGTGLSYRLSNNVLTLLCAYLKVALVLRGLHWGVWGVCTGGSALRGRLNWLLHGWVESSRCKPLSAPASVRH